MSWEITVIEKSSVLEAKVHFIMIYQRSLHESTNFPTLTENEAYYFINDLCYADGANLKEIIIIVSADTFVYN